MDLETARCIARLSGDGHINQKYGRYNNKCKNLLDSFERDIKVLFKNIHLTKGKVNSGTSFLQFHNKIAIKYFLNYHPDYKSGSVYIPQEIKDSNNLIKREYLKAIFDDEGSVNLKIFNKTNEWKRYISIYSKSIKLLKDIKKLLMHYRINSGSISINYKKDKYWYCFNIYGKKNLILFKEKIGFNHPLKSKKLDLMLRTYEAATYYRNNKNFNQLKKELLILRK